MKNIPRFLHIPQISFSNPEELIFCTENNTYFEILKFKTKTEINIWIAENEERPVIFRKHEKLNLIVKYRGAYNFVEPDEIIETLTAALIFYEEIFKRKRKTHNIRSEEKLIDYIVKRSEEQNITRYRISQITGLNEATLMRYFNKSVSLPTDRAMKICDAIGIKYTFK